MLVAGIFTWAIAHEGRLTGAERFLAGAAVAVGGTAVSSDWLMALQEYPAGLCIAVAFAGVIGWPRQWWYVVPVLGAGLFIRELALPFALLAAVYAGWNRRWVEVGAWAALIAAWGVFMALHAQLAMAGPCKDPGHQHHDAQFLKTLPADDGGDFHFRGRA
ncbi:MAG: hypothetical protein ABT10_03605 [Novosphingobium sp. SCN 63-17]|nr:MAG: hypothetical protein ABT10_03605 [Novosphingobium sp. SCN 63-17]